MDALPQAAGHMTGFEQVRSGSPLDSAEHECEAGEQLAPLLLVTTVDIGDGQSDKIEVRQGDVPLDVAHAFVTKHSLPPAVVPRLATHLEENLLKVAEQLRAAGCGSPGSPEDDGRAVFHRLYQQAVALRERMEMRREVTKRSELESIQSNKTSMSWISSEMMRDRGAGGYDNYGEMLYAESLESLARKRDKAQRVKAQRAVEEVQGATFRPEISRHAQNLWGAHDMGSVPAWQRLSKVKMTKAQERLEMLRREKEEAEVRECTFKPQVNGRSERLMTERSQTLRSMNVSAHQQLYQDAIRRQQKQQDYQHWYPEEVTFQPKLNESAMSREFLRKSLQKEGSTLDPSAPGVDRHMALVNRLYASYHKLQNKLAEARSTLQNSIDPTTGKRLFHPATGRDPKTGRNTGHQPVGEYLYSLSQQQEEKQRAAAAEREQRLREEAAASKAAQGSKQLIKQLQHKRFKQIFEFLDVEGLGSIDLVALLAAAPGWLDDLDDEVRADLEAAAKLLQKRALKHNDSSSSNTSASTIFMPPPPGQDVAGASKAGGSAGSGSSSLPPTPTSCPARFVTSFSAFCALMEEVLAARRGPRTYLAPSPPRKYVPSDTYKPQINERSKKLASKVRPKDTPAFEMLYAENSLISQKLTERRAQQEAEISKTCTFEPRLVSKQLVREGRVMKAVREGSWWGRGETDSQVCDLEAADSLQQLAAHVLGEDEGEGEAAEPGGNTTSSSGTQAAAAVAAEDVQAGAEAQQLPQGQAPPSPIHVSPGPLVGFSSAEEAATYMELEREVAEMQRMLEEATAAAEQGQQSHSDQQYLSEILGLAQEQVDAMAPAISQLQGLELRTSSSPSTASQGSPPPEPSTAAATTTTTTTADGAAMPAAATAAAASRTPTSRTLSATPSSRSRGMPLQHTPKSSFKVTSSPPGEGPARTGSSRTAGAAAAVSGASSVSSAGQLQHAVAAALQELNASSEPDLVSKTLALSKIAAAVGPVAHELGSTSSGRIAAGRSSSSSVSRTLEGADLFELAAGAAAAGASGGTPGAGSSSSAVGVAGGSVLLEELAAAMDGILIDHA